MHRTPGFLGFLLLFGLMASAQDTLPHFSVTARGAGKILVSWHNPFSTVSQISVGQILGCEVARGSRVARSREVTSVFSTNVTMTSKMPNTASIPAKTANDGHGCFAFRVAANHCGAGGD